MDQPTHTPRPAEREPRTGPLLRFIRALVRRRKLLLLPMLVVPPLAIAAALTLPPTYKVTARFVVEDPEKVNPFLGEMNVPWDFKNRIRTIEAIVMGHESLRRVALAIDSNAQYLPAEKMEARIDSLHGRVSVMSLGPGLVAMSFTAGTPVQAKQGLDSMIETFLQETLRPQREAMTAASGFLDQQLTRLRGELEGAEDELRKFKTSHAEELPEAWRLNLDRMLALRRLADEAAGSVEAGKNRRTILEQRLSSLDPVSRQLESRLAQQTEALVQLQARLRDEHPDVQRAQAELAELQLALAERRSKPKSVTELERLVKTPLDVPGETPGAESQSLWVADLVALREARLAEQTEGSKLELLGTRLDEMRERVRAYPEQEQRLAKLSRDLEIKARVYDRLLEKYEDSLITRALAANEETFQVRLLEPPLLPTSPAKPNRLIVAIAGPFAAIALGLLLVLLAEALDTSLRSEDDVFQLLGRRPVARIGHLGRA